MELSTSLTHGDETKNIKLWQWAFYIFFSLDLILAQNPPKFKRFSLQKSKKIEKKFRKLEKRTEKLTKKSKKEG